MATPTTEGYKHSQTLRLGLVLIMKDESANLRRCIEPLREHLDSWCIVDTGSTDNSIELVNEILKDVPGKLYERPWVGFGYNRTEALDLAKSMFEYAAFPDCDDSLTIAGKLPLDLWEKANVDAVQVKVHHGTLVHYRPHVFRLASDWEYRGELHEFATLKRGRGSGRQVQAPLISLVARTEGCRSKDPQKYQNDAVRLERKLAEGTDPDLINRNQFYLAQSHLHYGNHPAAKINYQKRLALQGGYEEERYICCQELVSLCADDPELQTQYVLKSMEMYPKRLEAVFFYLKRRRERGEIGDQRTFAIASVASLLCEERDPPDGGLFILPYVYQFAFDDEFYHTAMSVGNLEEARNSMQRAVKNTADDRHEMAVLKRQLATAELNLAKADHDL